MNVLVVADRRPDINIIEFVEPNNIELIITLGDLVREELLPLKDIARTPKIGVYGNHDSGTYMPELGIWNMHLKTWDFGGLKFGGFQGCVRYKDNPDAIMYTQEQAEQMMAGFPLVDVFISHCPPRGINDEEEVAHQGFNALRSYIDQTPPKVWLHGHTYPTPEGLVTHYGPTKIEYVFRYKIINL
jgi:Icc-related predicted phosphoesterase